MVLVWRAVKGGGNPHRNKCGIPFAKYARQRFSLLSSSTSDVNCEIGEADHLQT